MAAQRIFLGVGKLGVENEGNENPQAGSRDGAPVGVLGQSHPPLKQTTGCENNA